jgi:hypothetical protein
MERRANPIVGGESRVFGLYRDFASLRSGVDALKASRFDNNDIAVLFPEAAVSKVLSAEPADSPGTPNDSKAFIGGTLGWLTYVRPEKDGVISAALVDLGVPQGEAELYEANLRGGRLLACIRSSSNKSIQSAIEALVLTGAERVLAARESRRPKGTNGIGREPLAERLFCKAVFVC